MVTRTLTLAGEPETTGETQGAQRKVLNAIGWLVLFASIFASAVYCVLTDNSVAKVPVINETFKFIVDGELLRVDEEGEANRSLCTP